MGLYRVYGLGSGSGLVGGTVSDGRPSVITAPVASGTTTVGSTLSVTNGTWNGSPVSYAYQWLRSGTAIGGATSNSYVLVTADFGLNITCNVVAINGTGGSKSATSNGLGPITNPAGVPANSVLPSISGGTPMVGQVLLANNGTWTNSPTSYSYQWKRDGAAITGATGSSYTLVSADIGATITLSVIATNIYGSSSAAVSAGVGPILAGVPVNTVAPTITGSTIQGGTLSVSSTGTWTNSPSSYTYQWQRNSGASGTWVDISAATSSTYTTQAGDVGYSVRCNVTASNAGGAGSPAASNAIGAIIANSASLTLQTLPGVTPTSFRYSNNARGAGCSINYQIAYNATGDFTSVAEEDVVFVDGESYGNLSLALNYTEPPGSFSIRVRPVVENDSGSTTITDKLGQTMTYDADAWSNVVSVVAADKDPTHFTFSALTNQTENTFVKPPESPITVAGVDNYVDVTITGNGWQYRKSTDGGGSWSAWTNARGYAQNGDKIDVGVTAGAYDAQINDTLSVGSWSTGLSCTTRSDPAVTQVTFGTIANCTAVNGNTKRLTFTFPSTGEYIVGVVAPNADFDGTSTITGAGNTIANDANTVALGGSSSAYPKRFFRVVIATTGSQNIDFVSTSFPSAATAFVVKKSSTGGFTGSPASAYFHGFESDGNHSLGAALTSPTNGFILAFVRNDAHGAVTSGTELGYLLNAASEGWQVILKRGSGPVDYSDGSNTFQTGLAASYA